MKCPFCGDEMELGLIQSPHEIAWIKGTKRKVFARSVFHKGAVQLGDYSFVNGAAVEAYVCKKCEKVIIDYSKNSEENRDG